MKEVLIQLSQDNNSTEKLPGFNVMALTITAVSQSSIRAWSLNPGHQNAIQSDIVRSQPQDILDCMLHIRDDVSSERPYARKADLTTLF